MSLRFDDVTFAIEPVSIGGEDYILREASGEAGCAYRNAVMSGTKITDGKPSGLSGIANAEPILVSHCLFKIIKTESTGKIEEFPVALETIMGWPDRIQKVLYKRTKEISKSLDMSLADPEVKDELKKN